MDREERPAGVDRTDSYTKDKSYTPREARSHLQKRVAEGWKSNDRQVLRQDTSDFEPRRQNKRLRYTIPLRYRRVPPKDEEKGIKEDEGPNIGYLRPAALDRENSRGSLALALAEYLEIVSTQWVPDDESREIVTLTVKDSVPKPGQEQVRCESRWKHIQSEAPTFRLFYNQVERTPGLGPDDIALVARLLNTVQKTCEKHFVHGRFLKPVILVYDGEDPDEALGVQKTATFVGLPIFTTSFPYRHATGKDFEGHPVRALLQSRFRLDSTKRRDKEQVITKTSSSNGHIVHVPQIWALIINKSTVITCSPLPVSELRGETIKILSYSEAQQDEALWSIHFIDAQGKTFYLPLRYCKTWFGLVKHIADNCVQDEWNLVRDQLLKDGPIYKLVNDKDDSPITADLWPKLVEEKKKTEVIRLRLVDNEEVSNRLLVTYCDEDGNEISFESDASSETQSVFSGDGGESDASESSVSSMPTTFEEIGPAVERLRRLRFRLQEADERKHTKKAEELRDRRIPALEEQILNLTAQGLDLDPPVRERPRTSIVIPSPYEYRPRSMHAVYHDSPLSPISQYYSPRLRSRSRSDSRSRPRRSAGYSRSAYDLSMEEAYVRGRSGQPLTSPTIHRSISRPKHRSEAEYYLAPRTRSRPRSHMPSRPSISRTSTPNFPQSRWNLVRSRFRIGQTSGFDSTPVSPTTKKSEIYYKPSEKQLARSYWDLVRSSVLGGDIHKLRGMKATQAEAEITDAPRKHIKDADDRQTMGGAMLSSLNTTDETLKPKVTANVPKNDPAPSEVQEVPQHSTTTTLQSVGSQAKQKKKVLFSKQLHEGKPKLKRLITLAQMETSALPKPPTQQSTKDTTGTYENDKTLDSPIFLWSTDHQLPSADSPAPELWKTTDAVDTEEESRLGSLFQKNSDENKRLLGPSITEELILHTILAEVHSNLKKPKRGVEQYSILYENTTEKSLPEVMAAMKAIVGTNATDTKETSAGDASHITSSQDQLASVKLTIFDLACKILHAFIPKGHDAVVISKYWGALHKLLTENDESVLRSIRSRLSDLCGVIRSIQMGVRAEDGSNQQRYQIPRALPAAFQHLVMLLIVISSISNWSDYSWIQMQTTFDDCESLLVEGRKQLLLMIHTDDYRQSSGFQAVDSEALLCLILANLNSTLSTEGGDFHLTEVYSEYTNKIQVIVRDSASVKVYDDIKLLREELDIIKNTLRQQEETLSGFRSTVPHTYGVGNLSVSVLDRMLEAIEQRIDDFDELRTQAETARDVAAQSISLKAESNNKAIIVFTVVTIIFLPLSFVTSYLGMNTSDLRAMQSDQKLFWAIGAPVAFVVLSAAMVVAYYWTPAWRVASRALGSKEKCE